MKDITLSVKSGQFVGIVGPSGAGKTTFLRSLLGLIPLNQGMIRIGGKDVHDVFPGSIGYVPQLETVDWNFPTTVEQIVFMGIRSTRMSIPWTTEEEKQEVYSLLKMLGLGKFGKRHISELSGGQRQRVFIARALVGKPKLLLLDEPTIGLDVKARHDIMHLLADLNRSGMTILLTTHDLNSVAAHLPWLICLNQTLIAQGPLDMVFKERILSKLYDAPLTIIQHTGVLGDLKLVAEASHYPFTARFEKV